MRARYEYEYCPVNYIDLDHKNLIGLFSLWRQGKMLNGGGIGDQPAKYVDIMQMLDGLWSQAERASIERAGKKNSVPSVRRRKV